MLVPGAHLRLPGTTEGSDGCDLGVAFARARQTIAALLRGGRARVGEKLTVHDLDRSCAATIVSPTFLDPEGKRLHA